MKPPFLPRFPRSFSCIRLLSKALANGIVFSWQDAIWAQRLQFQNLLAILRANKNRLSFDAKRLRTIDDYQRQVPISDSSKTSSAPTNYWDVPDWLKLDSPETHELPRLVREARRLAKKSRKPWRFNISRPVLVIDNTNNRLPLATNGSHHNGPKFLPVFGRFDFLSELTAEDRENSGGSTSLETLLRKKQYTGIVGLSGHQSDLAIPSLFYEMSHLRMVAPSLEFVILDQPTPKNKPPEIVWLETLSSQGCAWAHFHRETGFFRGFSRAGLFWEFLPSKTPQAQYPPKRWWLGNLPPNQPVELVLSSSDGLLARRTGTIVSLVDRNRGLFQINQQETELTFPESPGFRTNQQADHQSKCDTLEGWPKISRRNSW